MMFIQICEYMKRCARKDKTIYKKTDALQGSIDYIKIWLIGGLTTIVASLVTLIVKRLCNMLEKLIDPISNILDKFVADKDLKQKLEHELKTELHRANMAQIEVNKEEAKT